MDSRKVLMWIEENACDISVFRDFAKGRKFELTFNTPNGCTASVQDDSLTGCVGKAVSLSKGIR